MICQLEYHPCQRALCATRVPWLCPVLAFAALLSHNPLSPSQPFITAGAGRTYQPTHYPLLQHGPESYLDLTILSSKPSAIRLGIWASVSVLHLELVAALHLKLVPATQYASAKGLEDHMIVLSLFILYYYYLYCIVIIYIILLLSILYCHYLYYIITFYIVLSLFMLYYYYLYCVIIIYIILLLSISYYH